MTRPGLDEAEATAGAWGNDDAWALAEAEARLAAYVQRQRGAAFAVVSAAPPVSKAEIELAEMLAAPDSLPEAVSLDVLGELAGRRRMIAQRVHELADAIMQHLSYLAWVETRAGGDTRAWTVVTWLGDASMLYRQDLSQDDLARHERELAGALAARCAFLSRLATAARGAALLLRLYAELGTPLGALRALVAAWQFISTIMDELRMQKA